MRNNAEIHFDLYAVRRERDFIRQSITDLKRFLLRHWASAKHDVGGKEVSNKQYSKQLRYVRVGVGYECMSYK